MEYDFTIKRPIEDVWNSFKDISKVASCMPGAELTEDNGNGKYKGNVRVKLGPFSVFFEGEAEVNFDDRNRTCLLNYKDGYSRSVDYRSMIEFDENSQSAYKTFKSSFDL